MNTTTSHTRATRSHCPAAWIGSGIYTTTHTTDVTCELPLTTTDGDELPNTTCGYDGPADINYDDTGLYGTWECPTCHRTNDHTPTSNDPDGDDGDTWNDTNWDDWD